MLHVLNQVLYVLSLLCVPIQLITQKFTKLFLIDSCPQFIWRLFPRYDKLELIGVTQHNPVQMFNLFLFSHLETVDENLSLRFGDNEEMLPFLQDGAVTLIYTQGVYLDVVFLYIICTDICLSLLKSVYQQTCNGWILRNVDDVRLCLLLLKVRAYNGQTDLLKGFISTFLQLLFPLPFLIKLLLHLVLGFHGFSEFLDLILQEQHLVLVLHLDHLHVVHVNHLWRLLYHSLVLLGVLKLLSQSFNLSSELLVRTLYLDVFLRLGANFGGILGES